VIKALTFLGGLLVVAGCDWLPGSPSDGEPGEPVRITMEALHQAGGVPQGWRFRPPRGDALAGRQAFVDFGCYTCHAVQGEEFPDTPKDRSQVGPDLTGMGSHHPAEYFAEAILNPNAVLVEGPGYIGDDGRSIMPEYPDMMLSELADLVAYVQSLGSGGDHNAHLHHRVRPASADCESAASSYILQVEEVTSDQIRAFDDWFVTQGAAKLAKDNDVARFDAFVNRSADTRVLVTLFGFEDDGATNQCLHDLQSPGAAARYGGLLGEGSRIVYRSPVVYKAVGISLP